MASAPSAAQDEAGITVSGAGEVRAMPNRVEIDLTTACSAELSADAIVKYRDAKRRITEAFAALQMKNLKIEEHGLALNHLMAGAEDGVQFRGFVQGGQAPAAKTEVQIAKTLRVALTDVRDLPEEELMETVAKVLDTAKDSGATLSAGGNAAMMARMYGQTTPGSIATFVLGDVAELREQAYQKAIAQAGTRAQRLAKLANVKLGAILSVRELPATSGGNSQQRAIMAMYGVDQSGGEEDTRVTSEQFAEIPVRVHLQVRFAIQP